MKLNFLWIILLYLLCTDLWAKLPCHQFLSNDHPNEWPKYVTDSDKKYIKQILNNEEDVTFERIIAFREDGYIDPPWELEDWGPPYYDGDKFIIRSNDIYLALREDSVYINKSEGHLKVWAMLEGEQQDELYLWFELLGPSGKNLEGFLKGHEAYDMVIGHFRDKVKCIKGEWVFGTNLTQFNKSLHNSETSFEEAASRTWSGKMADRYGFQNVTIMNLDGNRGSYDLVQVKFCK